MKKHSTYHIRTDGFEKVLVGMLHIIQTVPVGKKCQIIIDYDPALPKVKIETFIDKSGMEQVQGIDKEKIKWLEGIGAKRFPVPILYTYTFPGYTGNFNLSESYIRDTPIEELKAQYNRNQKHVELCFQGNRTEGR